ncbi:glycoside hydrolase family 5 protein [Saccharata proteae CBS 121410]|uniref:Glycoside hydrolase family 5 protein n=1 Tax=Saccharata proteae CBS 121410 TaxID=1314787 RepID=A0A9P4M0A3_9PEZI|nr:glycoside hydrolase family 5 protein [Saccharata proteae CBS 121410]
MDKYINKAKAKLQSLKLDNDDSSSPSKAPPIPPNKPTHLQQQQSLGNPQSIPPPTAIDVLRYRYHHGCNLGAVYVLEKWLFPSMYPKNCPGNKSSELECVKASVKEIGLEQTREKWEKHWANALTDSDLDWLVDVGHCTTIRLPIGYFTLGPQFCAHTPFSSCADVYVNAWSSVKQLTSRCRARGIGILLDLHGLPGGANGNEHSGTNSGAAEHWKSSSHRKHSLRVLEHMAREVHDDFAEFGAGIAGIQACNEAEWEAKGLYDWYDDVLATIGNVDPSIPVYISDAWNLGKCLDYVAKKNAITTLPTNPVVADTHLYWTFGDADKKKSPQQIIKEVGYKLGELDAKEGDVAKKGAVAAVIGEYSCVLSEDTWNKRGSESREDLERQFGQAQSAKYQHRAFGSFYWTLKMDWMPGGGWGFVSQTQKASIPPPAHLTISPPDTSTRLSTALSQRDSRCQAAFNAHCQYWDHNSAPDTPFDHQLYEQGWKTGFDDAAAFFGMRAKWGWGRGGGDKIGSLELWVLKRVRDGGVGGACVWEFEQGVRRGVGEFCEAAGGL